MRTFASDGVNPEETLRRHPEGDAISYSRLDGRGVGLSSSHGAELAFEFLPCRRLRTHAVREL